MILDDLKIVIRYLVAQVLILCPLAFSSSSRCLMTSAFSAHFFLEAVFLLFFFTCAHDAIDIEGQGLTSSKTPAASSTKWKGCEVFLNQNFRLGLTGFLYGTLAF